MREYQELIHLYDISYRMGGWLSWLADVAKLTEEEITFLEQHDDSQIEITKVLEKEYYEEHMPKIQKDIAEFVGEFSDKFKKPLRKSYLEKQEEKLKQQLYLSWTENEEAKVKGIPLFLRKSLWEINKVPKKIKKLENIKRKIYFLENKKNSKRFTELEIEQALEVPTKKVFESQGIKVNKGLLSLCPFHQEKKPSMNVRGTFYYCHGCGASGNNVDFLMKHSDLSFPKAIEYLLSL